MHVKDQVFIDTVEKFRRDYGRFQCLFFWIERRNFWAHSNFAALETNMILKEMKVRFISVKKKKKWRDVDNVDNVNRAVKRIL